MYQNKPVLMLYCVVRKMELSDFIQSDLIALQENLRQ
jgi:hypothetical protein